MSHWLDYCLEKARELDPTIYRQRLYAVVCTKRGRILGEGSNSFTKTSPMNWAYGCRTGNRNKTHAHAEIVAIARSARIGGKPHSIYIARTLKDGSSGMAAPCPSCALAIKEAGIKIVSFTI